MATAAYQGRRGRLRAMDQVVKEARSAAVQRWRGAAISFQPGLPVANHAVRALDVDVPLAVDLGGRMLDFRQLR